MMIRAAICDDEANILTHLHKRISEEFRNRGAECSLDKFMSGEKFLESHRTPYDVVFLDIDMPQSSGFEVAEQVNNFGETLIVFVTSHDELVYSSFKFRPFRFIRKAYLDQELPEIIADVINEITKRTSENGEKKFTLHTKTGDVVIDLRSLEYIEIYGHWLLVHVKNGEPLECYGSLSEFEKQLERYDFVRTHKSYLVNCAYIYSIEKNQVILDDKTAIPLSRYKSETVRNKFVKLLQGTL